MQALAKTPVKGSNQAADGVLYVATTVRSSRASTFSNTFQTPTEVEALAALVTHFHVKTTSFAVNGSPSLQVTPSSRLKVTVFRSSVSSPFSTEGTSVTRFGIRLPSGR